MRRREGFSLTEMLAVIAVLTVVLSVTGRFFADGWKGMRRVLVRAENNQRLPFVMRSWQDSVSVSSPESWEASADRFRAGAMTARQTGPHLVISNGDSKRAVLLPRGSHCAFTIEREPGRAPCAVMTVTWDSRYSNRREANTVRLVACGRGQ